jgi:hypothetical protein
MKQIVYVGDTDVRPADVPALLCSAKAAHNIE